jgi:hypothetical protein
MPRYLFGGEWRMTKEWTTTNEAADRFEDVRRIYGAVLGRHPDNSETLKMLCDRFTERCKV